MQPPSYESVIRDWKGEWTPAELMGRGNREYRRVQAVNTDHGTALEVLLTHYPWIVYLGYSLWRKLLVMIFSRGRVPLRVNPDPVPELSGGRQQQVGWQFAALKMGQLGDLEGFTQLVRLASPSDAVMMLDRKSIQVSDLNADFVEGLIVASQADVLHTLVSGFGLDGAAHWTFSGHRTNTHSVGRRWRTPLLRALDLSPFEHISLLLIRPRLLGAPAGAPSDFYENPLIMAAMFGFLQVVNKLIEECGVDPGAQARGGATALHYAADNGETGVVARLLEFDTVDCQLFDEHGRTPLHLAVRCDKNLDVVSTLLCHPGANVNFCIQGGWSPLHVAAQYGSGEVIPLLIEAGASIHCKAPGSEGAFAGEGAVALHLAAANQHQSRSKVSRVNSVAAVHALLVPKDADVNVTTDNGETVLYLASQLGNTELVSYLLRDHQSAINLDLQSRSEKSRPIVYKK